VSTGRPVALPHLAHLAAALTTFGPAARTVEGWGQQLATVLLDGGRLLAAGNGGSAAQAQHLTAELVGRYRSDRRPFSAICLSAETSSLTAICNDYPPEELFARQVEAHGRRGDVLVLLSTSGASPNIVEAARRGLDVGMTVWAFTGPRPNPLAALARDAVCVDSPWTATVQELHLVGLHVLCGALDRTLGVDEETVDEVPAQPSGLTTTAGRRV
jgi:D-sedoheptulose 7-phosphate isomerase